MKDLNLTASDILSSLLRIFNFHQKCSFIVSIVFFNVSVHKTIQPAHSSNLRKMIAFTLRRVKVPLKPHRGGWITQNRVKQSLCSLRFTAVVCESRGKYYQHPSHC